MTIPHIVRSVARECYQFHVMTGRNVSMGKDYSAQVDYNINAVVVGNYKGDIWNVPIAKSWIGL